MTHPLADVLRRAAAGAPPPADGAVELVPPWRERTVAVVALTGHAYVAAGDPWTVQRLEALGADGFGGAHHPAVVTALADGGEVDSLDVLLVGRGTGGGGPLVRRPDLDDHPRAAQGRVWRDDLVAYGDPVPAGGAAGRGVLTLGRGVAGLTETSIEVAHPGLGTGRGLLADGLRLVPFGDPVWARVAPGNVASLRLFLGAGFVPVASAQLALTPPRPRAVE